MNEKELRKELRNYIHPFTGKIDLSGIVAFVLSEKQSLLLQIEEIVGQKKQRSGGETEYWRGFIEGQNSEVERIREGLNKLKE